MGVMLPSALLITTGAKTRQPRTNPVVQIATNGGGPVSADTVSDPAEQKRLWAMADRVYPLCPDHRRHAARCHRTIPIIRLRAAAA